MIKRKSWSWPTYGKRNYLYKTKTVTKGIFHKRPVTEQVPVYRDGKSSGYQEYTTVTVKDFYMETIEPFLKTVDVISINEYYQDYGTVITVFYNEAAKKL